MSIQFPDVPNLPGVPAVLRNLVTNALDTNDAGGIDANFANQAAAPGLAADAPQRWGIYDASGQQLVIVPDSIVGVDFRAESRVADYPIENGAFGSYNKVQEPFDFCFTMTCSGDAGTRKAFLDKLKELKDSCTLCSAVTPEDTWKNITIERYDWRRDARSGVQMLTVQVMACEVRPVTGNSYTQQTGQTPAQATQQTLQNTGTAPIDPATTRSINSSDLKNQGKVQAAPPTPAQDGASNHASGSANDGLAAVVSGGAVPTPSAAELGDMRSNPPAGFSVASLSAYQSTLGALFGVA